MEPNCVIVAEADTVEVDDERAGGSCIQHGVEVGWIVLDRNTELGEHGLNQCDFAFTESVAPCEYGNLQDSCCAIWAGCAASVSGIPFPAGGIQEFVGLVRGCRRTWPERA